MPHLVPSILTSGTAKKLLEGDPTVSLDLGLTETTLERTSTCWILPGGITIDLEALHKIAEQETVAYLVIKEGVFQVALAGKHFYKLLPTAGAPTIEIDGIRMHRTSGTTPDHDARSKLDVLGLDGGKVLDTCTGLGYTAIESVRRGAEQVITVELDPLVIRIAMVNPWSAQLFSGERIHMIIGDTYELSAIFPECFFEYVIHDPPRHVRAGVLYGLGYYRRLYRLMVSGGRLFHYTGEPGKKYRGLDVKKGVGFRLIEAGFKGVSYYRDVRGFTALKP